MQMILVSYSQIWYPKSKVLQFQWNLVQWIAKWRCFDNTNEIWKNNFLQTLDQILKAFPFKWKFGAMKL